MRNRLIILQVEELVDMTTKIPSIPLKFGINNTGCPVIIINRMSSAGQPSKKEKCL